MSDLKQKTIPFTKDAFEKLQSELVRLTIELDAVKERVRVAREMGDLSENGAYHYGKFELGSVGRQLRHIQFQLKHGFILQSKKTDHIDIGHTVTLLDEKKTMTYQIVSLYESDPSKGKISSDSPIGKAILGKKVGDTVVVETPVGKKSYQVEKID